jgi:hypothetical protein
VATVVAPAERWDALQPQVEDTITNLFIHYRDGQLPAAGAPAEQAALPAEAADGAPAPTEEAPISG